MTIINLIQLDRSKEYNNIMKNNSFMESRSRRQISQTLTKKDLKITIRSNIHERFQKNKGVKRSNSVKIKLQTEHK